MRRLVGLGLFLGVGCAGTSPADEVGEGHGSGSQGSSESGSVESSESNAADASSEEAGSEAGSGEDATSSTTGAATTASSEATTSDEETGQTATTQIGDEGETSESATTSDVPVNGPPDPQPGEDTENESLVHLVTKFYGAQRSGDGPNWLLGETTCHTGDGEAIGADLSGGWHDAGDHVKPTLTNAFASYVMLKAFEVYGSSFADRDDMAYGGAPNGIPDVLDEARYATDYLVKAHIGDGELVGMVGETGPDHSRWVTCPFQETLDPMYGGAPRGVSMDANADIAGITAGSLALMSQLMAPYDGPLADTYLTHAIEIYEIGKANPEGSNPGLYGQTGGFGAANAWVDEMLCGAVELYRATGEASYLTDALDFNSQLEAHFWAPNWGQSADYCRHSLFVAGEEAAALEFWTLDVENYAAQVSSDEYVAGIIYFDDWGSLRYAANAAFSAALHYEATGETSSRDLAMSQLLYVKGENEYDRSFVVGFGNNPPKEPHHRNAHGHDENDMELEFLHTLSGALVGGPTRGSAGGNTTPGYVDDVTDYVGNEVALDYNAGLVGLAAFAVAQERL